MNQSRHHLQRFRRGSTGRAAWIAVPLLLLLATLGVARAEDAESTVEKCPRKLGSVAVHEPQTGGSQLSGYGLGSPVALIRLMIQQSGCFDAVERGVAMQNLQQERALATDGEMRQGSNIGKGQLQAADFVMTTNIQFVANNAGGVNSNVFSGLGGILGRVGGVLGGLKFKEAQTSLLIADVRSGIQVAAAEGSAKKTDFNLRGWGYGAAGYGSLGGYTNTPEGKVVASSLLDNFNRMVVSIRDQESLIKPTSRSADVNAAGSTRAQSPQAAGEMLGAKIGNVKVYETPKTTSRVIAVLRKTDELVATGEVENGFIKVDAANFSGWVQRTLVTPLGASQRSEAVPRPDAAPRYDAATRYEAVPSTVLPAAAAQSGSYALQQGFTGLFYGNYYGPDEGEFAVSVLGNGYVSGSGRSDRNGKFGISGNVAPNGAMLMSSAGQAGGAQFIGTIDPTSGRVTGSWYVNGAKEGGNFNGQRR